MEPKELLIRTGEWLLPHSGVDLTAWACVACDQFTSQREYWERAARLVGEKPSTLKLILPESYLEEAGERIPKIHQEMERYLAQGLLEPKADRGFILTVRRTGSGTRTGLVALMDLEGYDFRPGSDSLIRATEGTILERIPPRLAVRRGAALEMSHVLMLLDDPGKTVVEPLLAQAGDLELLYDFPLMMEGGHVTGYAVTDPRISGGVRRFGAAESGAEGEKPCCTPWGTETTAWRRPKPGEELKPGLSPRERRTTPRFGPGGAAEHPRGRRWPSSLHRLVTGYEGPGPVGGLGPMPGPMA